MSRLYSLDYLTYFLFSLDFFYNSLLVFISLFKCCFLTSWQLQTRCFSFLFLIFYFAVVSRFKNKHFSNIIHSKASVCANSLQVIVSIISLYLFIVVSLFYYIIVSLYYYIIVSLYHCIVSFLLCYITDWYAIDHR